MKKITKGQLGKRGFKQRTVFGRLTYVSDNISVRYNALKKPIVSIEGAFTTHVPNCKTLEDLDNLIKLFS